MTTKTSKLDVADQSLVEMFYSLFVHYMDSGRVRDRGPGYTTFVYSGPDYRQRFPIWRKPTSKGDEVIPAQLQKLMDSEEEFMIVRGNVCRSKHQLEKFFWGGEKPEGERKVEIDEILEEYAKLISFPQTIIVGCQGSKNGLNYVLIYNEAPPPGGQLIYKIDKPSLIFSSESLQI